MKIINLNYSKIGYLIKEELTFSLSVSKIYL